MPRLPGILSRPPDQDLVEPHTFPLEQFSQLSSKLCNPSRAFFSSTRVFALWPQEHIFYFALSQDLLLLLSCFSHVRLFATPWTAAHQAPPSMGFSRQEHWSGVPLPFPLDLSRCQSTGVSALASFLPKKSQG